MRVKYATELPAVSIPRNDQLDFSNKHKIGNEFLLHKTTVVETAFLGGLGTINYIYDSN